MLWPFSIGYRHEVRPLSVYAAGITVLFLDGSGQPLSEPIVGVANVDFYAYYLERRIDKSRQTIAHTVSSDITMD